jgi:phosphatidylglycerophosphate synthase
MLDRYAIKLIHRPLTILAQGLDRLKVTPNQVTLLSFSIGMLAVPLLAMELYVWALLAILLNRVGDGLDGALARRRGITDFGGFLDIVCDFIFYSAVVFGFALADPANNALYAALLILAFIGTGCSFMAFAVMAAKKGIEHPIYQHKSLYYLGGLTEGSETIFAFVLFCLFPAYFAQLAMVFAALCAVTTAIRILTAWQTFGEHRN